jgi:hypothetical protein
LWLICKPTPLGHHAPRRRRIADEQKHDIKTIRGEPAIRRDLRAANLYSVDPEGRDHDAVVRIGGETPRRRSHSKPRLDDHVHYRVAATSGGIGRSGKNLDLAARAAPARRARAVFLRRPDLGRTLAAGEAEKLPKGFMILSSSSATACPPPLAIATPPRPFARVCRSWRV